MAIECVTAAPVATETKPLSGHKPLSFSETVRHRRSCRAFLQDKPVPDSLMREVLEEARLAPSNCNTQPWHIHIVSGKKLRDLAQILLAKASSGEVSLDFSFDLKDYGDCYRERKDCLGRDYYQALGIAREDAEGRKAVVAKNLEFFDAPHAAFLFQPAVGDGVRVAGDIGMYAQTFLLSLTAHGLGGVPQTYLGFYADAVRKFLNISEDYKLLFGISFGFPDPKASINSLIVNRAPLEETVTFHH